MTTQPATGTDAEQLPGDGAEAEARADRARAPRAGALLVDLDPVRGGEAQHEADLVQRQDGEVRAGDEDRDADDPVLAREPLDQRVADGSRSTGSRAASAVPRSPSRAAIAAAISSTGKPGSRLAHDHVGGEHVRDVEGLGAGLDGDDRDPARFAARSSRSSSSVGAPPSTRTRTAASSTGPPARTAPRRGAARELLRELRGERAA